MVILAGKVAERQSWVRNTRLVPGNQKVNWMSQDWGDRVQALFGPNDKG